MRQLNGKIPSSPVHRFLLGAGFGIAISIAIFAGVENVTLRIIFMLGFASLLGASQVVGGGATRRSRKVQGWMLAGGASAFVAGVVLFFTLD